MSDALIWRTIFGSLRPVLLVSKALGFVTFNFSNKSLTESTSSFIANVLAILVYTPVAIYGIWSRVGSRHQALIKTTDIIQLIVSLIYVVIAWIMSMLHQRRHIKLLQEIKTYDKSVSRVNSTLNYDKTTRYVWINIFARIVIVITVIASQILTYEYTFTLIDRVIFYVAQLFPILVNAVICLQSVIYIHMISHRFESLNKLIYKIVKNNNIQHVRTIETINVNKKFSSDLMLLYNVSSMHHHLVKIIKVFNKTFGITLLVMFALSFVNIVIGLYFPCANFRSEKINWKLVINCLLYSLPFMIDTIYICYGCNSTIEEFKKSGILIHKIDSDDYDMKDEIEMFSLQIANNQVEFNAAGFFPVNFTLLFSIIGGITTYIIILIQLSNN